MESADGCGRVIRLHRLSSVEVVVNAELIEWIDSHGAETVLTLATGNKIIVRESVSDIIAMTIAYKKTVFAGAVYLPELLKKGEGGHTPCP